MAAPARPPKVPKNAVWIESDQEWEAGSLKAGKKHGPYKYWRHSHRFIPADGGTRVFDDVHYGVPGGALVQWLVVGRDVRKIFEFRQRELATIPPATSFAPSVPLSLMERG